MFFDRALRDLKQVSSCAGVPLEDLVRVHQRSKPSFTVIHIHVGGSSSGDVREARLLQAAIADRANASGARVLVYVHRAYGHVIAGRMHAVGKLEALLASLHTEGNAL